MPEVLTVGTNGGKASDTDTAPSPEDPPGTVTKDNSGNVLLKGEVTYVVPKGTPVKLKLASVPTHGLHLMDTDMDGNPYPAQEGQTITARVSEDLYVADNKVIPEGTVFSGHVSHIYAPRRVGRPGSLALTFDSFKTPDGRTFAFHAEANNTRESTWKSKAKGLGYVASYTAGGAITGALIAYEYFGLEKTIAMHGYNIAAAAAGGALAGTAYALLRKGAAAVLEPGDDLNMSIDTDLLLPAAQAPSIKDKDPMLEGFELDVLKSKVVKDGLDGHMLHIDAIVTNNSDKPLDSIDLYLEDDNGNQLPVAAGLDENSEYLFTVGAHTRRSLSVDFQLEYPKLKRKLVWLDHESRKVIIKERLP